MKNPELKTDNLPTEPGRYFYHRNPGFGSSPSYCTVTEDDAGGLSFADDLSDWNVHSFDEFWGIDEWLWSDRIEEPS